MVRRTVGRQMHSMRLSAQGQRDRDCAQGIRVAVGSVHSERRGSAFTADCGVRHSCPQPLACSPKLFLWQSSLHTKTHQTSPLLDTLSVTRQSSSLPRPVWCVVHTARLVHRDCSSLSGRIPLMGGPGPPLTRAFPISKSKSVAPVGPHCTCWPQTYCMDLFMCLTLSAD